MPYVKITTTSMPSGGLDGLIKLSIQQTFSKIVEDIQDQATAKGLEDIVSYKPGYKVFDLGNGTNGTMGDYFQLAFDGLYRAYINNWLQSTGINATYPASVIRSSTGAGYTPIVASDECH